MALGVAILLVDEIDSGLAVARRPWAKGVDLDDDVVPLRDHFLNEPLVGLDELVEDQHLFLFLRGVAVAAVGIEAAGADLVAVRRVDLSLVAGREGLGGL